VRSTHGDYVCGKESSVGTKTTLFAWQPPSETMEAIAAVMSAHWRAAKAQPERLYWPRPARWLHSQAMRFAEGGLFGARYRASLGRNTTAGPRENE